MALGKLIVLYGINNLGKSTQAALLVEALIKEGLDASYLKYPLYELEPSGPVINQYLRKGNPLQLSAREFQLLQIMNRTQYDSALRKRLDSAEWIVAEDYIGTGMAWGIGAGLPKEILQTLNSKLVWEDLGILFQGKRYMHAQEKGHKFETDAALTETVRMAHETLADEYGWHRVNAGDTIEEVRNAIWDIVKKAFKL